MLQVRDFPVQLRKKALKAEAEECRKLLRDHDTSKGSMCGQDTLTAVIHTKLVEDEESSKPIDLKAESAIFIMKGIVINQGRCLEIYDVEKGIMSTTFWLSNKTLRESLRKNWESIRTTDPDAWKGLCNFGRVERTSLDKLEKDIEFIMPTYEESKKTITMEHGGAKMELLLRMDDNLFKLNDTYEYISHSANKVLSKLFSLY